MTPPSIILLIFLCIFLLFAPRRYFLFPFIMAACFVPMNQRIIILNIDLTILRILLLAGALKLIIFGKTRKIKWHIFDRLILSWSIVGSLVYMLQQANFNAVINRAGFLFDSLGMYWLFRQVVQDWDDVFLSIKIFGFFAIITGPLIALEKIQESSVFSIFGPVQGQYHRERFRAAGPFPHYIMMGSFWVNLLPCFYAFMKISKDKIFYVIAIIAALSNIYCSASSTPLLTLVALIFFWRIYNYREHGKKIFLFTCFCLLSLHLIMEAPVWHLMARVNVFGGSTGWHRYYLFDKFIENFSDWFFIGTTDTSHWGHGLQDITNQFVLEGVRGGIFTLLLFVVIMYRAIKIPGELSLAGVTSEVKWMSWAICVAMLGHFVTFWGVSYFGQINMLLYFFFALVGFILEKSTADVTSSLTLLR